MNWEFSDSLPCRTNSCTDDVHIVSTLPGVLTSHEQPTHVETSARGVSTPQGVCKDVAWNVSYHPPPHPRTPTCTPAAHIPSTPPGVPNPETPAPKKTLSPIFTPYCINSHPYPPNRKPRTPISAFLIANTPTFTYILLLLSLYFHNLALGNKYYSSISTSITTI